MRASLVRSGLFLAATILAVAALAACQSSPPRPSSEPELKLLDTAALVLPKDCFASGSFVVSFSVTTAGRTSTIRAPDAPPCIQAALITWVESFRYEAPARPIDATMEWLMVTAKRGS